MPFYRSSSKSLDSRLNHFLSCIIIDLMSREGRKKEVHRVLNGFLWSKGGVTGREIFMHPPLSLSLSTGWRPTGKKSKAQKPHTV